MKRAKAFPSFKFNQQTKVMNMKAY